MKQTSATYTAPGQGLSSLVRSAVNYFSRRNRLASVAFNGHLSNAFVWRAAVGSLALPAAVVLEGYQISTPWAAALLVVAVATLVPAFTEYCLNAKEE